MDDIFDPNNWSKEEPEYRIYGDRNAEHYAVVDEVDYQWAIKWLWRFKKSGKKSRKEYLCRNAHEARGTSGNREGRIQHNLFLHVAIMQRTGIKPETPEHKIVDHIDGDERNCRRSNLQWVTSLANGRKRKRVNNKP